MNRHQLRLILAALLMDENRNETDMRLALVMADRLIRLDDEQQKDFYAAPLRGNTILNEENGKQK